MPVWQVIYFPSEDDKDSPVLSIKKLSADEKATIYNRLKLLSEREFTDWRSIKWCKLWEGKIYELHAKQQRVFFCLDARYIVVLYVCKKEKQKTHPRDANQVRSRHGVYLATKEK